MKNRLYSIAIFAVLLIPSVAPWEGGRQTPGDIATEVKFFSYMPALDLYMADLDVRDAQNQPVKEPLSQLALSELFMSNLFNLAVLSHPRNMEQIWTDLKLYSYLFRDLIFNIAYPLWTVLPMALQPSIKRFVHNVHNLWIIAFVGVLLCNFIALNLSTNSSPQRLNLRC